MKLGNVKEVAAIQSIKPSPIRPRVMNCNREMIIMMIVIISGIIKKKGGVGGIAGCSNGGH